MLRHLGRDAPDDVEYTGRQASLVEHSGDRHDGAWRVFRPLEHDGATRTHGSSDFANRLVVGKVPGRERRHHAHRLAEHELAYVGQTGGDHPTVNSAAFLGVPVAMVGAACELRYGVGQWFPLVAGHVAAYFPGALTRERADAAQHTALFHR